MPDLRQGENKQIREDINDRAGTNHQPEALKCGFAA